MIARLVESNYFQNQPTPSPVHVDFWLRELRSPELLIQLAQSHGDLCAAAAALRPLLQHALAADESNLRHALWQEQMQEQDLDRQYWAPLRKVLEELRRERRRH